jgi:hypothetical protein
MTTGWDDGSSRNGPFGSDWADPVRPDAGPPRSRQSGHPWYRGRMCAKGQSALAHDEDDMTELLVAMG